MGFRHIGPGAVGMAFQELLELGNAFCGISGGRAQRGPQLGIGTQWPFLACAGGVGLNGGTMLAQSLGLTPGEIVVCAGQRRREHESDNENYR